MTFLGIDWTDVGKNVFGAVHTAGGAVLNVFNAQGAAKSLESMEAGAGLLPDWAKSAPGASATPGVPGVAVTSPDYVVVLYTNGKSNVFQNIAQALIRGGKRFDGNGYKTGEAFGKHFSFGYDTPIGLALVLKTGQKTAIDDAKQVLFCGGSGEKVVVLGEDAIGIQVASPGTAVAITASNDVELLTPDKIRIRGGKRFTRNAGYVHPYAASYTFGYESPESVTLLWSDGSSTTRTDVKQIFFSNGIESGDDVLGDWAEAFHNPKWWEVLVDVATGGTYSTMELARGISNENSPSWRAHQPVATATAPVVTVNPALRRAQAKLALAQSRQAATSRTASSPIAVNVPSFQLDTGSTIMGIEDLLSDEGFTEIVGHEDGYPEIVGALPPVVPRSFYLLGCDVLGADEVLGVIKPQYTGGKVKMIAVPPKAAKAQSVPVKVAKKASAIATNAAKRGQAAVAKAASYKPAVAKAKTSIKGDDVLECLGDEAFEILGAAAPAKVLTPKQKAAVAKRDKAVAKSKAAVQNAAAKGNAALASAKKLEAAVAKQKTAISKLRSGGKTKTVLRGDDDGEIEGRGENLFDVIRGDLVATEGDMAFEILGDEFDDADYPPTPAQPVGSVPWQHVPGDGVPLPPNSPQPRDGFGSANVWYGTASRDGFLWAFDPPHWMARRGFKGGKDGNWDDLSDAERNNMAAMSAQYGWGNLIGNPDIPDVANLEWAAADQKWFWQAGNAPKWATAEVDAATALAQQQAAEAQAAADAADAARIAQEQAQIEEAQAVQDAANALAQSAADTQANIESQRQAAQQGQLDIQQAQSNQQFYAQQGQLDLQNQKQMLDYFAQHPEMMFQQAPAGGGGGDGSEEDPGRNVDWGEQEGGGGEENVTEADLLSDLDLG